MKSHIACLAFGLLISTAAFGNTRPSGEKGARPRQSRLAAGYNHICALLDDGSVECWVNDNGAGILKEKLERVFEEFESDSADGDGVGLGLPIIKHFVEAHGGRVSVESREGTGSEFRFTLPTKTTCERPDDLSTSGERACCSVTAPNQDPNHPA